MAAANSTLSFTIRKALLFFQQKNRSKQEVAVLRKNENGHIHGVLKTLKDVGLISYNIETGFYMYHKNEHPQYAKFTVEQIVIDVSAKVRALHREYQRGIVLAKDANLSQLLLIMAQKICQE